MTLHQLEAFALVAKLGSFTKAADQLHIGQPSVSALMLELQRELGVKLFEKISIRIRLTQAGRRFRQKTQNIMDVLQEAKDELDEIKGLKKRRLAIGSSGIGTPIILPAVQQFKRRHHGLEINLTIEGSEYLQQKLSESELDVAIREILISTNE